MQSVLFSSKKSTYFLTGPATEAFNLTKKDSIADVFLRVLRNFSGRVSYWTLHKAASVYLNQQIAAMSVYENSKLAPFKLF